MEYIILPNSNSQTPMKSRRRTRSQKEKSQSSSNNPEIKRRKCKTIQSKMVIKNADWLDWDADLLTGLGDVREHVDVSLGRCYSTEFYTDFAERLAIESGKDFRAQDVANRVTRLRQIYQSCKAADIFQHDVIDDEEYGHLLKRCFCPTIDAVPRVPRTLTANQNVGSRLSSRSAGSCASVSNEQMQVNAPTVMDEVLAELHTRNRERFDVRKLILFTRLLKKDPQVSNVFLMLQNHQQMLNFVDDLIASSFAL